MSAVCHIGTVYLCSDWWCFLLVLKISFPIIYKLSPKQTPATSRRDHCRRASGFLSQKEHHRTNIQFQDPLLEIPAAPAECLPCLHRLQEGIWQDMARSLMGNYEEIQDQRQYYTNHYIESLYDKAPECSPVQEQHRRQVQNYSRSLIMVSALTNPY